MRNRSLRIVLRGSSAKFTAVRAGTLPRPAAMTTRTGDFPGIFVAGAGCLRLPTGDGLPYRGLYLEAFISHTGTGGVYYPIEIKLSWESARASRD